MLQLSLRTVRPLLLATAATALVGSGAVAAPAGAKTGKATAAKTAKSKKKGLTRPDLVTQDLAIEDLGDAFAVDATIANTGGRRARASVVTIALSSDPVLGVDDELLGNVPLKRIPGAASRQLTTEVDLPEAYADGDLYLLVCADGPGVIRERVETNNCASELLTVAETEDGPVEDEVEPPYDDGSGTSDAGVTDGASAEDVG